MFRFVLFRFVLALSGRPRRRSRWRVLLVTLAAAVVLAGCASPLDDADAGVPRQDVTVGLAPDPAAVALLPAGRAGGVLTVGLGVGTGGPPSAFHLADNTTAVGLDIDMTAAVAAVLGLRVQRTEAAFDAILPGLGSSKFDVGTGNFAVTEPRKRIVDFVTYINDGQGFLVRADDPQPPIRDLLALCGRTVGVGAGTTFESSLNTASPRCATVGRPPIEIHSYRDLATTLLSLAQRRTDVVMSTINGLRYAAAQQPKLRYDNDFRRLDVGFALAKNSPLTPAVHAAMQRLMADGTYQRILAKWGVPNSGIPASEVDPPESS